MKCACHILFHISKLIVETKGEVKISHFHKFDEQNDQKKKKKSIEQLKALSNLVIVGALL